MSLSKYTVFNKHINKICLIQQTWKSLISFKIHFRKELDFFLDIINTIIYNTSNSEKYKIHSNNDIKKSMEKIMYCKQILDTYYDNEDKKIAEYSKFNSLSDLAKIKLAILEVTQMIGSININQVIGLYLKTTTVCNKNYSEKELDYLNKYFIPTSIESYLSDNKNNIKFKLNTYSKNSSISTITLASYQIDTISINKYNVFTKSLVMNLFGAKIYIPFDNKLAVLYGYFKHDNLNMYQNIPAYKPKIQVLRKLFLNLDINSSFRDNYLDILSVKDFLIYNKTDICSNCITDYSSISKIKGKNISQIVKEFMVCEIEKKFVIIKNLILDSTNSNNSGYLVNLLIDLIRSDNETDVKEILNMFNWNMKKIYKTSENIIEKIKKISNKEEHVIPYDKQIHLMKASSLVKSKALTKLKEIQSSKNGEGSAKAQQYLNGLLKVPFGNYKTESIRCKLDELIEKCNRISGSIKEYINKMEENNALNDFSLKHNEELINTVDIFVNISKNPLQIYKYTKVLKLWKETMYNNTIKLNEIFDTTVIEIKLKKLTRANLKNLCEKLQFETKGLKKKLSISIINGLYSLDKISILETELNITKIFKNINDTSEFSHIITSIEKINMFYKIYNKQQSEYFNNIDTILDTAVYGMDEGKTQIRRVLAQWINGKNEGYIFGLEGPPGTGKTTLAKKGISKCLKDEFGKSRPFIFIALGGSSNSSTLVGHNYTYVGSNWGLIVDGLIDSECMNPIIYIDELDKISRTEQGKEIVGILTHLTDPSQNSEFTDKYFSGIKFDLSKCLIIFSYNDANLIDKILLDRIQRIRIDPLTKVDKLMICKNYLIPDILSNIGFESSDIIITDENILHIIDIYTYEAGVRKVKEKLYELYRDLNLNYLLNSSHLPIIIDKTFIEKTFENYPKFTIDKVHNEPKIGIINGLFATSAGIGGITVIEAFKFCSNNHLELKLTGMQGDVMKESMNVALTLVQRLVPENILKKLLTPGKEKFGIHIHCPAGATKKDGPSAGTAITICILSLLCGIPINNTIGITGEIRLSGDVLPIGGLDSKVQGAKMSGLKKVLCPEKNDNDLMKIRKGKNNNEDDTFSVLKIANIYDALEETLIMPKKTNVKSFFKSI